MRTLLAICASVVGGVLGAPPSAHADYITGNDLYRYCKPAQTDAAKDLKETYCVAYITGVHDGAEASGSLLTYMAERDEPFRLMCVPQGVEAGQLRDIVVQYLEDHPADRNLGAGLIVMSALLEAYPCTAA